ncbi:Hypothetical protein, putative [Bodo saltans]|uniref:Uncharacterized protein n=1 Tax=Bodo saltans TaxID=75058 RepID=A0A0S4J8T3_BODSA|nr:Hypothetical protein, putative [Bodo saltans]|eukprot:CUG87805.1 Hypothetical protein, putative [Bodo saltans]
MPILAIGWMEAASGLTSAHASPQQNIRVCVSCDACAMGALRVTTLCVWCTHTLMIFAFAKICNCQQVMAMLYNHTNIPRSNYCCTHAHHIFEKKNMDLKIEEKWCSVNECSPKFCPASHFQFCVGPL